MGDKIDVKGLLKTKKEKLRKRVEKLKQKNIVPKLAVIMANNEDSSRIYVSKKRDLCAEMNIETVEYIYDESVTSEIIEKKIIELNNNKEVNGILIQLPLFKHLDERKLLEVVSPEKDVDGIHPLNVGRLLQGNTGIISCTPKGILTILESLNMKWEGKEAVIIGRSVIVGKPMASLLINKGMTVTVCNSKTTDLGKHTREADLLIVAAGHPNLVTKEMVKDGAVVIDVGINRIEGKIYGDVDTKNVIEKASYISTVPGGVGLSTVFSLIENLVEIAEAAIDIVEEIK